MMRRHGRTFHLIQASCCRHTAIHELQQCGRVGERQHLRIQGADGGYVVARPAIAPTAGDAPAGNGPPGDAAMLPAALGCAAPANLPPWRRGKNTSLIPAVKCSICAAGVLSMIGYSFAAKALLGKNSTRTSPDAAAAALADGAPPIGGNSASVLQGGTMSCSALV